MVSSFGQSLYREPLRPRVGVTSARHGTRTRVARHYPSFLAHTGSCAGPKPSPSLGMTLVPRVCAGCCAPLLDLGPSQRYLRESFSGCLDPYPGGSHWCTYPFLPRGQRPSPRREWLGTQQNIRTATSVRSGFSGLQSFANVQASRFARHPGRSYRIEDYACQGSRGFYFHAYLGLLPPRAVDMLAVRNRVTDGVGTFTPLDSRPCWPLPRRCHMISPVVRVATRPLSEPDKRLARTRLSDVLHATACADRQPAVVGTLNSPRWS